MESVSPGLAINVENTLDPEQGGKLSVNLNFKKMADLSPGEIARQVPALSQLLEARQQLANLQRYMNGKTGAQDQLKALLSDPKLMAALEERRAKTTDGKSEE
jgi:type VI secretion system protein ImpB